MFRIIAQRRRLRSLRLKIGFEGLYKGARQRRRMLPRQWTREYALPGAVEKDEVTDRSDTVTFAMRRGGPLTFR